ncbi:MAG: helix-turn-helix domain-containing protein [Oscillospiraceae bacterium]|nr:helix-turn-helix domain-containing protein [Oscillospiraceae bacterium]
MDFQMRLLMVDDELQIRNYLRTLVDWELHGYQFYEAENGIAAITVMESVHIDLLLLDITMPLMNGLELLEWIKSNSYPCVVTMLTGHDEFDYAVSAMRQGCFDYVLKNTLTNDEALVLVTRMKSELSEESQQQHRIRALEAMERRKRFSDNQYSVRFWLDSVKDDTRAPSFFEEYKFCGNDSQYSLLYISIKDYMTVVNRYTYSNVVQFTVMFDGVLHELIEHSSYFYTEVNFGKFLIFLKFPKTLSSQMINKKVQLLLDHIRGSFQNLLGIHSNIFYSLPYDHTAQSKEIYMQIKKLDDLSFWISDDIVRCLGECVLDKHLCNKLLMDFQKSLAVELESRDSSHIEMRFDDFLLKITDGQYCPDIQLFRQVCESCITQFLKNQIAAKADNLFSHPAISDFSSYKNFLMDIVRPHCISQEVQNKNMLTKKAILLIQQNYKQEIGLDWLATNLHVNTSYLSRVFSAEAGQTLTSYLNEYRIEKAKHLIKTTTLKLNEVAKETGFSSPIVFSSVFKKITGEPPSEYRNKHC